VYRQFPGTFRQYVSGYHNSHVDGGHCQSLWRTTSVLLEGVCIHQDERRPRLQLHRSSPLQSRSANISILALNFAFLLVPFLGEIALQRKRFCLLPGVYTFFFRGVVCLTVVCHIRESCLSRSTDLDSIRQVRVRSQLPHCVRWVSLTR